MVSIDCTECGASKLVSQEAFDLHGSICFRCRVGGVGFTFKGGGGYGREAFHEWTNREVVETMKSEAARSGVEIAPVEKVWS